jgi:hypothetical protein
LFGGTLQQADAAIPSTYHIGSIGAGGNWHGWVADAYASYGRQVYGAIQGLGGTRQSGITSGSGYFAAGCAWGGCFSHRRVGTSRRPLRANMSILVRCTSVSISPVRPYRISNWAKGR